MTSTAAQGTRPAAPVQPRTWGHVTGRFRALGHDFGVRTTDGELGRYLEHVFAAFAAPGDAATSYSISEEDVDGRSWFTVRFGDEELVRTRGESMALGMLLWHVNQETVHSSPQLCILHAAAAEYHGMAVVLPAPMEAGKTTLVAGLVRAGLRYLTDEAAAIDPCRLLVKPFPKALSVDPGSWGVLADLRPRVSDTIARYVRAQWQVPPGAMRPHAVAPATPVRAIVSPRYVEGAATSLDPITRAEALQMLVRTTFHFSAHGRRNFETLARIARQSVCYRLTVGDLALACDLVIDMLDQLIPPGGSHAQR